MKLKCKMAKVLTDLSVKVAKKAAGQVSIAGTYQPKEPKILKQMLNEKKF